MIFRELSLGTLETPLNIYTQILVVAQTIQYTCTLVSLQIRINLSPFTKDFRAEEQIDESIIIFQWMVERLT